MGYQNKENPSYWQDQSLADDANGDWIDARNLSCGSFAIDWADASETDAVVKVQVSHDQETVFDVSGGSVTIDAASGTGLIELIADEMNCPWVRLAIVANSETTGTVNARSFFKGDR